MKTQRTTKTMIIASVILLVGATIAFAHGGWGGGGSGPMMRGYGGQMMGPDCDGPRAAKCPGWGKGAGYGNLSEEDAAKVKEAREKFYTDTKEIRRKMNELRIDLRDEMTKDDPDSSTVLKMQKELSSIKADFDQKAIQHRLEMRKLVPEKFQGRGYGSGYGRGHGRGYGRGGGRCWE